MMGVCTCALSVILHPGVIFEFDHYGIFGGRIHEKLKVVSVRLSLIHGCYGLMVYIALFT